MERETLTHLLEESTACYTAKEFPPSAPDPNSCHECHATVSKTSLADNQFRASPLQEIRLSARIVQNLHDIQCFIN